MRQKQIYYMSFAMVGVIALVLLFIVPLTQVLYISFRDLSWQWDTDEFVGLSNYIQVFHDKEFLAAMLRNLLYVGVVVCANFVIGFGMALLCNTKFPGNRVLRTIIILPMLLIPAAGGVLWRVLYHQEFGLLNYIIGLLGFSSQAWLSQSGTALWAVMLTDIWGWTPWMFLLLLAGLESLPTAPIEAANVDGASTPQLISHIIIPMMRPIIFITVSLKAIDTFRTFDYVWVMTRGGPGQSSHILSTYIFRKAFRLFDYGYGATMSLISLMVSVAASMVFIYLVLRRKE